MAEWQPIETAPRDGTDIFVIMFDGDDYWYAVAQWWVRDWAVIAQVQHDFPQLLCFDPTHWMPLPEPPEASE